MKTPNRIADLICRRPGLLGWPSYARAKTQKHFPLLSGQVVDVAVWDTQNYWLVRVLPKRATDIRFERAVFECITFKAAFDAELQGQPAEALVLPVLLVARDVRAPLLDWAFELGVYVRCLDLGACLYG